MNIVILGAAESGVGAALLAKAKGHSVFVSDRGPIQLPYKQKLMAAGIPYEEGTHTMERVLAADESAPGRKQTRSGLWFLPIGPPLLHSLPLRE